MKRAILLLFLLVPVALAGCAGESVWAPDAEIEKYRYTDPGPPKLTLFTMISNSSGAGAHSAIMVSGSERVIFDPAGTVNKKGFLPERNDVLYGISPKVADFYTRAHARKTYHVVIQEVEVPSVVAEQALARVKAYGAVPSAQCTLATSSVLSQLPGFERIKRTWYPKNLSEQFDSIPGVSRQALYEYDDADKDKALRAYDPAEFRAQLATQ